MAKKLYVGNLSFGCKDADLFEAFSQFGEVLSARIVTDRESGRSKGFGFVEMASDQAAHAAIQEMHGKSFMGRPLTVNEARPREDRPDNGSAHRGGPRRGRGYDGRA